MRKRTIIGLCLLAFCIACRYLRPVADFKAFLQSYTAGLNESAAEAGICDKAKSDYTEARQNWKEKRVDWIEKAQRYLLDLMLKGNGVRAGTKDYFGVVAMVMTMDAARGRQ